MLGNIENEELTKSQKGMLRYFWPFAKKYWWAFLIGPAMMVFEAYADLKQPAIMQNIIDIGIANGDIAYIKAAGLQMLIFALLGLIGGAGAAVFCTIASLKFGASLREGVYEKVQSFSFGNIDYFKTGSLITRMTNDITQVTDATHRLIRMLVRSATLLIGSFTYIIIMSKSLTIVLYVSIPFILIIALLGTKIATPMFKRLQKRLDRVNTIMQENLAGVRVVKAFVRSVYEISRFSTSNERLRTAAISGFKVMAVVTPLIGLSLNFAICLGLYLGGIRTIDGTIGIGEFLAYLKYLSILLMSLTQVAMTVVGLIRARASKDRILEVLKVEPDINDDMAKKINRIHAGKVVFNNVSFHYDDDSDDEVLTKISFTAMPGQTIALLGETGSGKTSLINLIPRLYDASTGQVLIDDIDVKEYEMDHLRCSIGMSLQQAVLFSGSVFENIAYGVENAKMPDVIAAAKAAEAHDFIMEMEDGYDTMIEQKGVNLSGGQKQRMVIARAIMIKPKVLILDDSTSAVDVQTENKIQAAFKDVMKDCTSFIVAQRISSVIDADKILILENGMIADEGNHEQLIKTSEIYQDIYHSQLGKDEDNV